MKLSYGLICTMVFAACAAAQTTMPSTQPASPTTAPSVRPPRNVVEPLLKQLSAEDWKARQVAQDKLIAMGEDVIPDIKDLMDATSDEEVRTRCEAAIRQIQTAITDGPTRITLHYKDAQLQQVMDEISKQAKLKIAVEGQPDAFKGKTISIDVDRQPFWVVMKEITRKTGIGPAPYHSNNKDVLNLQFGNGFANQPAFYSGCFYVTAMQAQRNHFIDYGTNNAQLSFNLNLGVYIDPKMRVLRNSYQLNPQEAVDEKGNSLTSGPMGMQDVSWTSGQNYFRNINVQLQYKPEIGKKIAKLKGSARFVVLTKSERWELNNILSAKDVTKEVPFGKCTVVQFRKSSDNNYEIQIVVECPRDRAPEAAMLTDYFTMQQSMQLLDANNRSYYLGGGSGGGAETRREHRYTFYKSGGGANMPGDPVKLIWDIPLEVKDITVPIEFRDLALP